MNKRVHRCYRIHRLLNCAAGFFPRSRRRLAFAQKILDASAAILLALLSLCNVQQQYFPEYLGFAKSGLTWMYSHRLIIALWIIGLNLLCRFLLWLAKSYDEAKLILVLKAIAEGCFAEQHPNEHHYRATLFKVRCGANWLCGPWLGIVARSGTLYPKRTTVFSIDPNNKKYNTGIAGECWREDGATIITTLPSVVNEDLASVKEYKKEGYLDDREYNAMQMKSRVFLATGIRLQGKVWGILVLDTTDENKVPQREYWHRQHLSLAAVALGAIVS